MTDQLDFFAEHAYLPSKPTPTQSAAAAKVKRKSVTQRGRVLQVIAQQPSTDAEIQALLGLSGDSVRPRRKELQAMKLIVDSGYTRLTPGGNSAIVWKVTDEGKQVISKQSSN